MSFRSTKLVNGFTLRIALLILFVGLSIFFYLWSPEDLGVYDESIIIVGAMRIVSGEWPGSDFYANYGPLQFAIVAGLYDFFGVSVAIARLYDGVLNAGITLAVSGCLVAAGVPRAVPAALAASIIYQLFASASLYVLTPVTLLVLIGACILIRNLSRNAGLVAYLPLSLVYMLSIFFRYDYAIVAGGAFGIAILAVAIDDVAIDGQPIKSVVRRLSGISVILAAGAGIGVAFLFLSGLLVPAVRDIITYNSGNYVEMRSIPFPLPIPYVSPGQLFYVALFYLPFLILTLAFITASCVWRRLVRRHRVAVLVLGSVTMCGIAPALVRSDLVHMFNGGMGSITLLFVLLGIFELRLKGHISRDHKIATARWVIFLFLVLLTLRVAVAKMPSHQTITQRLNPTVLVTQGQKSTLATRLGPFSITPDESALISFIVAESAPGERFVSVTGRHDKVYVNNLRIYLAAGRLPGTSFHHFDPGVQTSRQVQLAMIQDLETNDIKIIFEDGRWDDVEEKNLSSVSSGVNDFDKYIAEHFVESIRIGQMAVLLRKPM